jgi:uncharacterized membrane protein
MIKPSRYLPREDGVSAVIAALYIGFVVGPLLALAIEIGRYAETRALIQQAADLAALAATQEADFVAFQETGLQVLKPTARSVAQTYINSNETLAGSHHISVAVESIDIAQNMTTCTLLADVSELFPSFVGHVTIRVIGTAEMRFSYDGHPLPP